MKRNLWGDPEVAAAVNTGFTAVMIEVDDPASVAGLSCYQLGATPTTIITDSRGTVLEQIEGGVTKSEFLELLRKAIASQPILGDLAAGSVYRSTPRASISTK